MNGAREGAMVRRNCLQSLSRDKSSINSGAAVFRVHNVQKLVRPRMISLLCSLLRYFFIHRDSNNGLDPIGADEDVTGRSRAILEV